MKAPPAIFVGARLIWVQRVAIRSLSGLLAALVLLAGCADDTQAGSVSVLYAGSLASVMEDGVRPAFTSATKYEFAGEAQGSLGAAHLIRDHLRSPDVFISADPSVNEGVLMGDQNENLVTWYTTIASSELVVGYSPQSRFAANFQAAAAGTRPWHTVLEEPGLRFGRGDPTIDPKGYRTLFLFMLAARHHGRPEIARFLGEDLNPDQVMPEVALLTRVESGQFDAGIFYKHEVIAHELPYISLPPEINLGDPRFTDQYAEVDYTTPAGERIHGAPILFTITIPSTVRNRAGAEAFVRFLLTSPHLLTQFGLGIVHDIGGDPGQMPADLRSLAEGTGKP